VGLKPLTASFIACDNSFYILGLGVVANKHLYKSRQVNAPYVSSGHDATTEQE